MKNLALPLIAAIALFSCETEKKPEQTYTPVRTESDSLFIVSNYDKQEVYIPMRDGTQLFTAIYTPKDKSQEYPFILFRTPYSISPYGTEKKDYRMDLGPNMDLTQDQYIFVYQDVRGKMMSEGTFQNMTPHTTTDANGQRVNESTDTYDTIDWLLANIDNHNGKVGQWGISYPGFYTAAGMISSHPALVCASPQAPIADWYFDDFHHHGAFFLSHAFNFFSTFDLPRNRPTPIKNPWFQYPTNEGTEFYESITPLSQVNEKYFGDSLKFWNQITEHPNYDSFWQERNILPHLKKVNCAVLNVGGWFDAEDLYGPLEIYQAVERNNPGIDNTLVMGPWYHGAWRRSEGDYLGDVHFGQTTSTFFNNEILTPFFQYHLKGKGELNLPEAWVFETGTDQWRSFEEWPPKVEYARLYLRQKGELSFTPPRSNEFGMEIFTSDPKDPVPFTEYDDLKIPREYMVEDQRFVADRKDVIVMSTEALKESITIAGPLEASLVVKTNQGDADWIVKFIDVYPADHPSFPHQPDKNMGGYQQMVRSEVLRGRYRNSYENPEPFGSMKEETITIKLQDVLHTFKPGHKIMIQIQSTWWPLVDLNPQKYVDNIFEAKEQDFEKAKHFIGRSGQNPSYIKIGILKDEEPI